MGHWWCLHFLWSVELGLVQQDPALTEDVELELVWSLFLAGQQLDRDLLQCLGLVYVLVISSGPTLAHSGASFTVGHA